MSVTCGMIFVLLSTIIVAVNSTGDNNRKNFEACQEKWFSSVRNTSCESLLDDPVMNRCVHENDVHFYCAATSPIQVVIGRLNHTGLPDTVTPESLNMQSFASSKNGHSLYCIKTAAKTKPADYFLQCHTNMTNRSKAKWIPFNGRNPAEQSVHSIQYINVNKIDPEIFCSSLDPVLFQQVPVLVPCDTWHMCAIVLASRYKNKSQKNVTVVDLSKNYEKSFSCSHYWKFKSTLKHAWVQNFTKPGLLAFRYNQSEFLLPYYYTYKPIMALQLKTYEIITKTRVECQSSVLHSCGLELVVKNLRIESSDVDCHRYFLVVEPIPGFNGSVTCSAFNEFQGTWDNETEYIESNNKHTKQPNETNYDDTSSQIIESTAFGSGQDSGGTPVLIIVGALLGGIFLSFLLLLPLLIYLYKRINRQKHRIRLTEEEICEFMEGIETEKAKSKGMHNVFVLPYDRSLEVSKIAVDFKTTILGSGAFGKVLKGKYKGQDVAIKTINGTKLNTDAFRSLLSELKIMSYLGKHEHVMELVGAITSNIKTGELFLLLEYCANGNVVDYIQEHREKFVCFLTDDNTTYRQRFSITMDKSGSELSSQHLVRWSFEVASGMEYVSSLNIYHGDLAARNILLTENLTAKVGDFGLSKQLGAENYACYMQKKECPLPLKWMAIESLRYLKFSIQSDVWSYGVTLWEFFSLGTIPYPGMEWNLESWKALCDGVRLDRPEFASMRIYNVIMRECWNQAPKDRPKFSTLKTLLQGELEAFNLIET